MKLDRRSLLISGGAGIGLVLAFALWPRHLRSGLAAAPGDHAFGSFIKIARDGNVTIAVPQVETGQGIWTGLPQIVADELGAAWDSVAVEPAPLATIYGNPMAKEEGWPAGMRITANSTSVRAFERPLREAAAAARSLLVGAAADRWNVEPQTCDTADGLVICGVRTVGFGELAEEAAARSLPRATPLRQSTRSRLIGKPLPRLDGPAKTDGSWRFAPDVRLPHMLYASARLAPPGGRLTSFSRELVERSSGVRHLVANGRWIAVVAGSWWQAEEALKAAGPQFTGERTSVQMRSMFNDALARQPASEGFTRGDYRAAVRGSRPLTATYFAAPSQHLQLEPVSATARISNGAIELWTATQAPGQNDGKTVLYPMPCGGPAGRAMEADAAPIAVDLARAVARPVQLILSQSATQNHDHPSPGAIGRLAALPGEGGITNAIGLTVATGDGLGAALARVSGEKSARKIDGSMLDGPIIPYSVPNVRVETIALNLPFAAGYMRGSPNREIVFFIESFIDELAHAAGMEPLAFRMSMLGGGVRLARCLQAAAQLASWDGGGQGSVMGIAGASAFGSHIGLVAVASIEGGRRIKAHRFIAAIDCGKAVNTDLVQQQIQGGLVWALAQATIPSPEWIAGMPRSRPLGGLDLPRLADTPEIVVEILPSDDDPGGVSGLGTLPVAPALANAIYAGSGRRLRSIPFDIGATS